MRRFWFVFLYALLISGCSALTGFGDLEFDRDSTGADSSMPAPDSTVEIDTGPDPMSDAEPDPDTGTDEDAGPDPDAFVPDAGPDDAGPTDGDSMPPDAFVPDAEVPDAGPDADVTDAGPDEDAGPMDAGPPDTGPTDTGPRDSGPDLSAPDAGPTDSGPSDTGPMDSGPRDAGPVPCAEDPTQERCLIHIQFVSSPRIQYYWLQRYVHGVDGGPGMTEAWHPCNGGVRLIDATTSECVYAWVPVPGTEVTFVPGYDADTPACNTAACLASPESVYVYDESLPMGAVTSVIESTPPVGSLPIAAFRITVPSP